jgi:thiol-disulfide isomerase/thioredoxin
MIKPLLPIIIIIAGLKITGQLETVVAFGQTAVLKTGVLNAGTENEDEEAFDFNFTAYSPIGELLQADSLRNKVIFLNIWATWCGPCRAEMPTIQSLYNSIDKTNIAFVMLAVDRNSPELKVQKYIEANQYTFPVYILKGEPTEQIRVPTIPTTFVISKEGKVLRKEVGMKNYDTDKFRNFLLKEANSR